MQTPHATSKQPVAIDGFWPQARLRQGSRFGSIAPAFFDRDDVWKEPTFARAKRREVRSGLAQSDVIGAGFLIGLTDAQAIILPEANRADLPIAIVEAEIVTASALKQWRGQKTIPRWAPALPA